MSRVLAFGDTLLVGDVGRPDLFPGREEELAEELFRSLERLKVQNLQWAAG